MSRGLALFNTFGVLVVAVIACIQWWENREEHGRLVDERRAHQACETELAELRQRATSLNGDVERLKAGLTDAQKAADEGSAGRAQAEGQVKTLTAEHDQLKQQLTKWEAAIKDRDGRIATISAQLRDTRARLDEAVKRLEGKSKQ